MWSALTSWLNNLLAYVGVFFSGVMAEKYADQAKEVDLNEKRDVIDAKPRPSRVDILKRMRARKRP